MPTILVIEDHATTRNTLALYLEREGFRVDTEEDGAKGLAKALQPRYALIIIDLMLPSVGGREICRRLRSESNVPIIMLTALSTEDDMVKGLGLGADDYITKPFSPRELVARVRARLRPAAAQGEQLRLAGLTLDANRHELRLANRSIALTNTEFQLLEILMRAPGRVYSRDELIERALGHDYGGSAKNIDMHISNIRKRIEPDRNNPQYIQTVIGRGYRFCSSGGHDGDS